MSISAKPDLRATGTRFEHYMELKEVFMEGVEILERRDPKYLSDDEKEKLGKMRNAAELIGKRLEILANFEDKTSWDSELRRELNAITPKKQYLLPPSSLKDIT